VSNKFENLLVNKSEGSPYNIPRWNGARSCKAD